MFMLMPFIKFGEFSAIISLRILSAPFSLSPPAFLQLFPNVYVGPFDNVAQAAYSVCFSSIFFSLSLSLNNFLGPIFKFTDSLLYMLKSASESLVIFKKF